MMIKKIKQVYKEHEVDKERIRLNVISNRINYGYKLKPILVSCVSLLILIGCFSITREVNAYNEAMTFFDKHNLSTDGLSRKDIKKVYIDITTGKFSYDKTAVVIIDSVGGHEIFQQSPTPEDIENLWENRIKYINLKKEGISYSFKSTRSGSDYEKDVFCKNIDGNEVWNIELGFIATDYTVVEDSVCVYGYRYDKGYDSFIVLIDMNGVVQWQKIVSNGFKTEIIESVLYSENEITVFSRGNLEYLCFSKYDINGNRYAFKKNDIGNYGIWSAARLGDGYIVHLGNYSTTGEHIIKVDSNGNIIDSFMYSSENQVYYIKDMIEFDGFVYLSAYCTPKSSEGEREISGILNYIYDNKLFNIESEEITELVRDNYTAILLACSPDSGKPNEFYSIKGSLGGKLSLSEDGKLFWKVESITDAYYSLAASSFSICGSSYVYRYTFDNEGTLIKQEKTGEVEIFRR